MHTMVCWQTLRMLVVVILIHENDDDVDKDCDDDNHDDDDDDISSGLDYVIFVVNDINGQSVSYMSKVKFICTINILHGYLHVCILTEAQAATPKNR